MINATLRVDPPLQRLACPLHAFMPEGLDAMAGIAS
jgi:hypothetical protein